MKLIRREVLYAQVRMRMRTGVDKSFGFGGPGWHLPLVTGARLGREGSWRHDA